MKLTNHLIKTLLFASLVTCSTVNAAETTETAKKPSIDQSLPDASFTFSDVTGIGAEEGYSRRDPSDVVKVGDTWYVWYSKMTKGSYLYPSGYDSTLWYATSKDAGKTWQEQSVCLARGSKGKWDCFSVFTPNIILHKGTWYLYYTAVGPGFKNSGYKDTERTAIGVATSKSPRGPWIRYSGNPVLKSTTDPAKFDSFRVDDVCLAHKDGKIWFYYKGRQWKNTPRHTALGVATSVSPLGPFMRENDGNPVVKGGHEVQIWLDDKQGVYSLTGSVGPAGICKTLRYAADGIHFKAIKNIKGRNPSAPGLYRPELTGDTPTAELGWGVHIGNMGRFTAIGRFELPVKK